MCSSMRVDAAALGAPRRDTNASRTAARPAASSAAGGRSPSACGTADGATGVHPPSAGAISMPPSQGRADEPLRPACASWIATGIGGACRRARASVVGERLLGGVVVEPEAARRDPAFGGDRGRFDGEHAGARQQHLAPVDEVPVGGAAVVGGVLAHRRDDDAIGERQAAQRDRVEQRHAYLLAQHFGRRTSGGQIPAATFSASALSVASQVNSGSSRPKWP